MANNKSCLENTNKFFCFLAAVCKCLNFFIISVGKTFVKAQKVDEKIFVKKSKPRRPDRLNKVPRIQIRPNSAPASRQSNQEPAKSQPFLAYGCGAAERETSTKKTFNVRASSAVSI